MCTGSSFGIIEREEAASVEISTVGLSFLVGKCTAELGLNWNWNIEPESLGL